MSKEIQGKFVQLSTLLKRSMGNVISLKGEIINGQEMVIGSSCKLCGKQIK